MFGIGPTEFIIIAVVALMLFSPRELPKILRGAAKFWGSLRNTADEFRDAIMNEEEMQDIRGVLQGTAKDLRNAESSARRELMKARMEMQKAQNKLLQTVKASEEAKRAELAATASAEAGTAGEPANAGASEPANEGASAPAEAPATAEPNAAEPANIQTPAEPPPVAPHGAVAAVHPTAGRDQGAA